MKITFLESEIVTGTQKWPVIFTVPWLTLTRAVSSITKWKYIGVPHSAGDVNFPGDCMCGSRAYVEKYDISFVIFKGKRTKLLRCSCDVKTEVVVG